MTPRRRLTGCSATLALSAALLTPKAACADITAFLGTSLNPTGQWSRGVAAGTGLVIIGFEFEVAQASEQIDDGEPGLTTGSVNVLLQTPLEVSRTQFYATSGVGLYRERLGDVQETNVAGNIGGGVKIRMTGPLKVRLDYRMFRLRGEPLRQTAHRLYAGATLGF